MNKIVFTEKLEDGNSPDGPLLRAVHWGKGPNDKYVELLIPYGQPEFNVGDTIKVTIERVFSIRKRDE